MTRVRSEHLEDRFRREFLELCSDQTPIVFELTPLQAWIVFVQLQVALRHPANDGISSQIAYDVAKNIEKKLPMGPAMAELAKRGWDPNYDVDI